MPRSPLHVASSPFDKLMEVYAVKSDKRIPSDTKKKKKKIRKSCNPPDSPQCDIALEGKAALRDEDALLAKTVNASAKSSMIVKRRGKKKEIKLVHAGDLSKLSEKKATGDVEGVAASPKIQKRQGTKRKIQAVSTGDLSKQAIEKQMKTEVAKPSAVGAAEYRKSNQIVVSGTCPAPFETFADAEPALGEALTSCLRQQGYDAPTPIQAQAWPIAMRGQDLVAVSKTGSGKTCGFLLPALAYLRGCDKIGTPSKGMATTPRVLVLAPTRELAQQISGEVQKFASAANCRVVALFGGVPKNDQVHELKLGTDVVVATPGRLLDFSKGNAEKGNAPLVSMKMVTYLVLDEADRMLDMGFEADIRKIVAECPPSKELKGSVAPGSLTRQTLFFTATWPKQVQATASSLTSPNAVQLRIGQGAGGDELTANKNVRQIVSVEDERQKLTKLKEILEKELAPGESCFVFAKTKKTCDYLESKLWDEKEDLSTSTWCRAIHSHREQWERDANLATFRNITIGKDNGRRGILVATDVAARGLDIPGVALVVVYDFGGGGLGHDDGVKSYVHRIGRTGRAGKMGKAFTFFTEHDTGAAKLVELLDEAKQRVPYELRSLAEKEQRRRGGKGGNSASSGRSPGHGGKGFKGKGHGGKHGHKGGKGKGKYGGKRY